MFETGIRDTGVWVIFQSHANNHSGRFTIVREGDLRELGSEIEAAGFDLAVITIDRSTSSPCRDRRSLDFQEERFPEDIPDEEEEEEGGIDPIENQAENQEVRTDSDSESDERREA